MTNVYFKKSGAILWTALGCLLVIFAIYLALGRLLISQLEQYRDPILQELNVRTPFNLEADAVAGEWRQFSPVIVLRGVRLGLPEQPENTVQLVEGQVGVDVWNSLWSGSLQVTHLLLRGLTINGELSEDGNLHLQGMDGGGGETSNWIEGFLLNARYFALEENIFRLKLPSGEVRELDLNLSLSRTGSGRRAEASLSSTRGTEIRLLANGLGNPFKLDQFRGDLYVDIQSSDMGAARDLVAGGSPAVWADGELGVEFWLSWDKGAPAIETRVEAENLRVSSRDGDWSLPLRHVEFQANIEETGDRWTLYTSDFEVQNGDSVLQFPRMQLDAWGKAVRLRTQDVDLAELAEFSSSFDLVSENVVALLEALNPRGSLSALQLNFSSFDNPASDWEASANFESLALQSYRGAPGTSSARGYARLVPGEAKVIFDTHDFDLSFPTIYHDPLLFDQLYGSLDVNWDKTGVSLSSGLLTAQGEEGVVKALFGLDIPLVANDVGAEMELLVGIRNADVKYRSKYIPFTLSESLRNWLDKGIVGGDIAEGGFLWRGALKSSQPTRRTVQLGFNISDTTLDYHPDWPPVAVESGVVIIDDGRVRAAGSSGKLLQSGVEAIAVETQPRPDKSVGLSVQGTVRGPASDGLYLLNHSPLTPLVGGAFTDWTAEVGQLETHLELNLVLGPQPQPPDVNVSTLWNAVDLSITPANLVLQQVEGGFDYSTHEGFRSSGMKARLWGEPVQLGLKQHHDGLAHGSSNSPVYDAKRSTLAISANVEVDMADVQNWLSLQPLELANGRSEVELEIFVHPGESPLLVAQSDLQGVSLDLPRPWRKPEQTSSSMLLVMNLGAAEKPILLNIEDTLKLSLELGDGGLQRGGLGIGTAPPHASHSEFRIAGKASHIAGDDWLEFITRYLPYKSFADDSSTVGQGEAVPAGSADPNNPLLDEKPGEFRVVVDALSADSVEFMGQTAADATLDLSFVGPELEVLLDSDWLDGRLRWPLDGGKSSVAIESIDLAHFGRELGDVAVIDRSVVADGLLNASTLESTESSGTATVSESEAGTEMGDVPEKDQRVVENNALESGLALLDLPDMDVAVANIYQGERRLGDVSFVLTMDETTLAASNITGELAAIQLTPENPASVVWERGEDGYTRFSGLVSFTDFGSTLTYFGYEKIVQTRSGNVNVDMRWPGSPTDFALSGARGSLILDVDSGSFLSAPGGAAGALRVVNILNLVHLVQRLSVTHMFESGIPFDSVEGEIYMHEGTIEIPVMRVKGGSSFQFSGVSDVSMRSLEGEMVATLPVAKNLPWVAALAASLPVAAGVYVVSKIFDKQVNKFSSAVYKIRGTWDDPQINFSRIFDDSSRAIPVRPVSDPNEVSIAIADEGDEPGNAEDPNGPPELPEDPNGPQEADLSGRAPEQPAEGDALDVVTLPREAGPYQPKSPDVYQEVGLLQDGSARVIQEISIQVDDPNELPETEINRAEPADPNAPGPGVPGDVAP